MSAREADEAALGVECAWPATTVHMRPGPRRALSLRAWLALAVFVAAALGALGAGETVWREARAWLTPALTSVAPSPEQPDRGGERASQG